MRKEITDNELENVTGGRLEWYNGEVYSITETTARYRLIRPQGDCVGYITQHCFGKTDLQTLEALAQAGYLEKVIADAE